jgi:hypothetical protein
MSESVLFDVAGRRRSPATLHGYHAGQRAAEQGSALPGRSADRGGDRVRDAPGPCCTAIAGER